MVEKEKAPPEQAAATEEAIKLVRFSRGLVPVLTQTAKEIERAKQTRQTVQRDVSAATNRVNQLLASAKKLQTELDKITGANAPEKMEQQEALAIKEQLERLVKQINSARSGMNREEHGRADLIVLKSKELIGRLEKAETNLPLAIKDYSVVLALIQFDDQITALSKSNVPNAATITQMTKTAFDAMADEKPDFDKAIAVACARTLYVGSKNKAAQERAAELARVIEKSENGREIQNAQYEAQARMAAESIKATDPDTKIAKQYFELAADFYSKGMTNEGIFAAELGNIYLDIAKTNEKRKGEIAPSIKYLEELGKTLEQMQKPDAQPKSFEFWKEQQEILKKHETSVEIARFNSEIDLLEGKVGKGAAEVAKAARELYAKAKEGDQQSSVSKDYIQVARGIERALVAELESTQKGLIKEAEKFHEIAISYAKILKTPEEKRTELLKETQSTEITSQFGKAKAEKVAELNKIEKKIAEMAKEVGSATDSKGNKIFTAELWQKVINDLKKQITETKNPIDLAAAGLDIRAAVDDQYKRAKRVLAIEDMVKERKKLLDSTNESLTSLDKFAKDGRLDDNDKRTMRLMGENLLGLRAQVQGIKLDEMLKKAKGLDLEQDEFETLAQTFRLTNLSFESHRKGFSKMMDAMQHMLSASAHAQSLGKDPSLKRDFENAERNFNIALRSANDASIILAQKGEIFPAGLIPQNAAEYNGYRVFDISFGKGNGATYVIDKENKIFATFDFHTEGAIRNYHISAKRSSGETVESFVHRQIDGLGGGGNLWADADQYMKSGFVSFYQSPIAAGPVFNRYTGLLRGQILKTYDELNALKTAQSGSPDAIASKQRYFDALETNFSVLFSMYSSTSFDSKQKDALYVMFERNLLVNVIEPQGRVDDGKKLETLEKRILDLDKKREGQFDAAESYRKQTRAAKSEGAKKKYAGLADGAFKQEDKMQKELDGLLEQRDELKQSLKGKQIPQPGEPTRDLERFNKAEKERLHYNQELEKGVEFAKSVVLIGTGFVSGGLGLALWGLDIANNARKTGEIDTTSLVMFGATVGTLGLARIAQVGAQSIMLAEATGRGVTSAERGMYAMRHVAKYAGFANWAYGGVHMVSGLYESVHNLGPDATKMDYLNILTVGFQSALPFVHTRAQFRQLFDGQQLVVPRGSFPPETTGSGQGPSPAPGTRSPGEGRSGTVVSGGVVSEGRTSRAAGEVDVPQVDPKIRREVVGAVDPLLKDVTKTPAQLREAAAAEARKAEDLRAETSEAKQRAARLTGGWRARYENIIEGKTQKAAAHEEAAAQLRDEAARREPAIKSPGERRGTAVISGEIEAAPTARELHTKAQELRKKAHTLADEYVKAVDTEALPSERRKIYREMTETNAKAKELEARAQAEEKAITKGEERVAPSQTVEVAKGISVEETGQRLHELVSEGVRGDASTLKASLGLEATPNDDKRSYFDTLKDAALALKTALNEARKRIGYVAEDKFNIFKVLNNGAEVSAEILPLLSENDRIVLESPHLGLIFFDGAKTWMKNGFGLGGKDWAVHDRTYNAQEIGNLGLLIYFEAGRKFMAEHPEIAVKMQTQIGDEIVIALPADVITLTPAKFEAMSPEQRARYQNVPKEILEGTKTPIEAYRDAFNAHLKTEAKARGVEEGCPLSDALVGVSAHGGTVEAKIDGGKRTYTFGGRQYNSLDAALAGLEVHDTLNNLRPQNPEAAQHIENFIDKTMKSAANKVKLVNLVEAKKTQRRDIAIEMVATFRVEFDPNFKSDILALASKNGKGVTHIEKDISGPSVVNQLGHPIADAITKQMQIALDTALNEAGLGGQVKVYVDGPMAFAFELVGVSEKAKGAVLDSLGKALKRTQEIFKERVKDKAGAGEIKGAKIFYEKVPDPYTLALEPGATYGTAKERAYSIAVQRTKEQVSKVVFNYQADETSQSGRGAGLRLSALVSASHLYYDGKNNETVPRFLARDGTPLTVEKFMSDAAGVMDPEIVRALRDMHNYLWVRTPEDFLFYLKEKRGISPQKIDTLLEGLGFRKIAEGERARTPVSAEAAAARLAPERSFPEEVQAERQRAVVGAPQPVEKPAEGAKPAAGAKPNLEVLEGGRGNERSAARRVAQIERAYSIDKGSAVLEGQLEGASEKVKKNARILDDIGNGKLILSPEEAAILSGKYKFTERTGKLIEIKEGASEAEIAAELKKHGTSETGAKVIEVKVEEAGEKKYIRQILEETVDPVNLLLSEKRSVSEETDVAKQAEVTKIAADFAKRVAYEPKRLEFEKVLTTATESTDASIKITKEEADNARRIHNTLHNQTFGSGEVRLSDINDAREVAEKVKGGVPEERAILEVVKEKKSQTNSPGQMDTELPAGFDDAFGEPVPESTPERFGQKAARSAKAAWETVKDTFGVGSKKPAQAGDEIGAAEKEFDKISRRRNRQRGAVGLDLREADLHRLTQSGREKLASGQRLTPGEDAAVKVSELRARTDGLVSEYERTLASMQSEDVGKWVTPTDQVARMMQLLSEQYPGGERPTPKDIREAAKTAVNETVAAEKQGTGGPKSEPIAPAQERAVESRHPQYDEQLPVAADGNRTFAEGELKASIPQNQYERACELAAAAKEVAEGRRSSSEFPVDIAPSVDRLAKQYKANRDNLNARKEIALAIEETENLTEFSTDQKAQEAANRMRLIHNVEELGLKRGSEIRDYAAREEAKAREATEKARNRIGQMHANIYQDGADMLHQAADAMDRAKARPTSALEEVVGRRAEGGQSPVQERPRPNAEDLEAVVGRVSSSAPLETQFKARWGPEQYSKPPNQEQRKIARTLEYLLNNPSEPVPLEHQEAVTATRNYRAQIAEVQRKGTVYDPNQLAAAEADGIMSWAAHIQQQRADTKIKRAAEAPVEQLAGPVRAKEALAAAAERPGQQGPQPIAAAQSPNHMRANMLLDQAKALEAEAAEIRANHRAGVNEGRTLERAGRLEGNAAKFRREADGLLGIEVAPRPVAEPAAAQIQKPVQQPQQAARVETQAQKEQAQRAQQPTRIVQRPVDEPITRPGQIAQPKERGLGNLWGLFSSKPTTPREGVSKSAKAAEVRPALSRSELAETTSVAAGIESPNAHERVRTAEKFLSSTPEKQDFTIRNLHAAGKKDGAAYLYNLRGIAEAERALGLAPGVLKEPYLKHNNTAEAAMALSSELDRRGIYKTYLSGNPQHQRYAAQYPAIGHLLLSGELTQHILARVPAGSKITGITGHEGIIGAYEIKIVEPSGHERSLFAKREDLRPAAFGAKTGRIAGIPTPEIITEANGRPFTFVGSDGVSTTYGLMEHIKDFEGGVNFAGREIRVSTVDASSLSNLKENPRLLQFYKEHPEAVFKEIGYASTGLMLTGSYDSHSSNLQAMLLAVPPAEAPFLVPFLESNGYTVVSTEQGPAVFKIGRIDTDAAGQFLVSKRANGGYDISSSKNHLIPHYSEDLGKALHPFASIEGIGISEVAQFASAAITDGASQWHRQIGSTDGFANNMRAAFMGNDGYTAGIGQQLSPKMVGEIEAHHAGERGGKLPTVPAPMNGAPEYEGVDRYGRGLFNADDAIPVFDHLLGKGRTDGYQGMWGDILDGVINPKQSSSQPARQASK
ncbi:hypothetical protein HY988_00195 [Candidatus Micrarchaeota archaeon]|nr:hypothetical protein [Candidatus Micrarchaeota archaeon]